PGQLAQWVRQLLKPGVVRKAPVVQLVRNEDDLERAVGLLAGPRDRLEPVERLRPRPGRSGWVLQLPGRPGDNPVVQGLPPAGLRVAALVKLLRIQVLRQLVPAGVVL